MKYPVSTFICTTFLFAFGAIAEEVPRQVALLSVSTDTVWLEVGRPESRRPPIALLTPEKEPYSMEDIQKVSETAQAAMIRENGKVRNANRQIEAVNENRIEKAVLADSVDTHERQEIARGKLAQTPLGRAVATVPQLFGPACSSNGALVVLAPRRDDVYLSVADDVLLVSLLFQEPKKTPGPSPVPNTSNEPVRLAMSVMLKAESQKGQLFFTQSFEQSLVVRDQDRLLGKDYDKILEQMIRDAMREVARRLAETEIK